MVFPSFTNLALLDSEASANSLSTGGSILGHTSGVRFGGGGAALVRVRRKENSSSMRIKFKASLSEIRSRIFSISPLTKMRSWTPV